MGGPVGNQFWKKRTKHGRSKAFTPTTLWKACCEYFEWVEQNPFFEEKIFCSYGEIVKGHIEHPRPKTIEGLTVFLGIQQSTWAEWKKPANELSGVAQEVDRLMREDKFSGAAAGIYNSNIIARDLGLRDNQDHTSSDGSMSQPDEIRHTIVDPKDDAE